MHGENDIKFAYEFLLHPDEGVLLGFTPSVSFYKADHVNLTSSPPSSEVHVSVMFFLMTAGT
jgi:hypothetical protein